MRNKTIQEEKTTGGGEEESGNQIKTSLLKSGRIVKKKKKFNLGRKRKKSLEEAEEWEKCKGNWEKKTVR